MKYHTHCTVYRFCGRVGSNISRPLAPRIVNDIAPFLAMTSEDTLALVLDTLSVVVEIGGGDWITTELANAIVNAVFDVWYKNQRGLFPATIN